MDDRKLKLRGRYSFKDLAILMETPYHTFRREVVNNGNLMQHLHAMGWHSYKRFYKEHVLEIFSVMGYPDGYEWYEKTN
jgi:hypothetical protein